MDAILRRNDDDASAFQGVLSDREFQGRKISTVQNLAVSPHTKVYRLKYVDRDCTVLKLSSDVIGISRELQMNTVIRPVLADMTPQVLAGGTGSHFGWIEYADEELTVPRWTNHRYAWIGTIAADIHERLSELKLDGAGGLSHTPPLCDVHRIVRSSCMEDAVHTLVSAFGRAVPKDILRKKVAEAERWPLGAVEDGAIWCHGDLHLGNIMWSHKTRRIFVIDWAFLHRDVPYFDLFQAMDATSPTTPLRRFGRRFDVLAAYHKSRRLTMPMARWVRGYARYSTLYLLWILTRIAGDMEQARHPASEMYRQMNETVAGLYAVSRLHRVL